MKGDRNIVLVTPGFPKDESDHLCMPYLQEYLKHMLQHHPEIRFRVVSIHYPYQPKEYEWNGIEVVALGGNNNRFPARLMTWRKALRALDRFQTSAKIDVVHSLWLNECTYLAQRWTRKNNIKLIATAMGQDVLSDNRYLNRIDLSALASVAVSNWQNEKLKEASGVSCDHIISWGLDALKTQGSSRDIDILGVGSFTKLKDFETFLKVVKAVGKQRSGLNVMLIGYGPEREGLERLARDLGLEKTVQFTGELPRPKVLQYMQRSKVLLHPSKYESQGYVFNEALACGMGVVSREVGIAQKSERWKIAGSEVEMAEAVMELIGQSFEPMSIQPLEDTAEAYIKLYYSI